jgi:hypothetical protein
VVPLLSLSRPLRGQNALTFLREGENDTFPLIIN